MKSRAQNTKIPKINALKDEINPAFNDSGINIRKVTPSIIPEEKPSPNIKLLSDGLIITPSKPPIPVATPAIRLMIVMLTKSI